MTTLIAINRGMKRLLFFSFIFVRINIDCFNTGTFQQVDTICQTILFAIDDPFDTGLYNEFCTLDTW